MHIESADALADAYSRAANDARHAIAELSPLVTESLALLERPGQNPIHGPIPALQETANALREDKHDLEWRVELLRSTDAQPLGVDGRILGFAPNNQPASSQLPHPTQDRNRLAELNNQIDNWQGSDNDPLLDALLAERRDIETRQTDRRRSLDDQLAAFRRSEAESWTTPEWTPLETAEHSLTQISNILDTAKHDRGRGIGATVADGIWSTEDLETIITNEHGYYSQAQVAHAQTVQAMATSSPEARDHLGITESDDGWTFTDIGHLTLDIFGMVPVVGNAADGINATWYAAEGHYLDAALSSIALIPGLGQIIAPARHTIRAAASGRVFRSLDDALAWTKAWIESTGLWRFSDEAAETGSVAAAGLRGTAIPRTGDLSLDLERALNHLNTVDGLDVPHQQAMVDAISRHIDEGTPLSEAQRAFLDHELLEAQYVADGMEQFAAHNRVLEDIPLGANFDPEVLVEHSEWFSQPYFDYWGMTKP